MHLACGGELVISQSHEDAVTFQHHVCSEGEKHSDDASQDYEHVYDLRDPVPPSVAVQELHFFLGRMVQDLMDGGPLPEIPPGEKPPE